MQTSPREQEQRERVSSSRRTLELTAEGAGSELFVRMRRMRCRVDDPTSTPQQALYDTLNGAAITLCLSIGHRTGLLDYLASVGWVTSGDAARATGLQTRYVQEWLDAMVAGAVLGFDSESDRYRLPAHVAPYVSSIGGPLNVALHAQYLSVLGSVEDEVVEAFREGGGVPYDRYPRYQEVRAEKGNATFQATLLDQLLPSIPGLPERLESGLDVVDVGSGAGHAVNLMAARYPSSRFLGIELSTSAVRMAEEDAARANLSNVQFRAADAADLVGTYDLVLMFDVLHDLARPAQVLAALRTALRSDGLLLVGEVAAASGIAGNMGRPLGAWMYTLSLMHCMTVSLAQGGPGFGNMWGTDRVTELLRTGGFVVEPLEPLVGDSATQYFSCTLAVDDFAPRTSLAD
jgi:2-polyprenyl-3-methyl-5-hydroxy-6-metoxy-1,4-benzoquinol methylase